MTTINRSVEKIVLGCLTAAVLASVGLVIETKSRLAVIEVELERVNATAGAIMEEIQRIHPRQ